MSASGSTGPAPSRRRGRLWWVLAIAFVVVPLVEIYVIIQIGQVIGALWTIVLLVADSILGSWLVKREGKRAWEALSVALREGRMPARELADGVLILVGGLLMLTPGFVLDIVGAICILPFTRPLGRAVLAKTIANRLQVVPPGFGGVGGFSGFSGNRPSDPHAPQTPHRPGPDVVRGDVVDQD